MSSDKTIIDVTTPVNAANTNLLLTGDQSSTYALGCWGIRIRDNGSAWEVHTTTGATDQTGDFSFSPVYAAFSGLLTVTLANTLTNEFSSGTIPGVWATPVQHGSNDTYLPHAQMTAYDTLLLQWHIVDGSANCGDIATTSSTKMDCNVLFFGKIG